MIMDPKTLRDIALKMSSGGRTRTAGKIEFIRDQGPVRRNVRVNGFKWTTESLRDLAKILWAAQRAHSYGLAAYRLFTKMPSSQFSPDGLLGGVGYIQSVKDLRGSLGAVVESLSAFTDTVHDEINADHWSHENDPEVAELVDSAQEVKQNPEAYVEDEYSEENTEDGFNEPLQNPNPDDYNPSVESDEESDDEEDEYGLDVNSGQSQYASFSDNDITSQIKIEEAEKKKKKPASQIPTDSAESLSPPKEFSFDGSEGGNFTAAIRKIIRKHVAALQVSNSSLPVDTLPGPRVNHIGPAEGTEAGHFNFENVWPSDDLTGEGLFSGVDDSNYIYEDWTSDGVTGYDDPTRGDNTKVKTGSGTYSWLPGSRNEKNLDYYARGLTEDDINWMRANSDPDPPPSMRVKKEEIDHSIFWDDK